MYRHAAATLCIFVLTGVATAQENKGHDPQRLDVLWDNGPVNYDGARIRNDQIIHPADLIWDNGDDTYANGYEMTQWIEANDFTLANVAVVGHIDFSVLDTSLGSLDNWDGTGEWFIYEATGGGIGGLIESGNLTNFETVFDRQQTWDFYDFSADLDNPVRLDPGTYYIGLHLNQNGCRSRDELYWGDTNPNGSLPRCLDQYCDGSFSQGGSESAFTLSGRSNCMEMEATPLVGGKLAA